MSTQKNKKLYKIKSSSIHNRGIFSSAFIPKGTQILEYLGEKITKAESDRRAAEREAKARKSGAGLVYIFELNSRYDIDGNFAYNPARLMNHSCEPNCEAEIDRGHIWVTALRDIEAGEELSYDYGYDMENFLDHPCLCGSESCIGYIVRKDQRWRVRRMLQKKKQKAAEAAKATDTAKPKAEKEAKAKKAVKAKKTKQTKKPKTKPAKTVEAAAAAITEATIESVAVVEKAEVTMPEAVQAK